MEHPRRNAAEQDPRCASQAVRPDHRERRPLRRDCVQEAGHRWAARLQSRHLRRARHLRARPLERLRRRFVELLELLGRVTGCVHECRRNLEVNRLHGVHDRHQQQLAARFEQDVRLTHGLQARR